MCNKNEEVELIGFMNIALNKQPLERIYQDLNKIHKIAIELYNFPIFPQEKEVKEENKPATETNQ